VVCVVAGVQERWHNPPDVWIQLLRRLLCGAACREALLEGNSVASAEHRLARFAISLAEELAAATAPGQTSGSTAAST
jgi:hypothetical protein